MKDIIKEIKKLKFTGKVKAIDYETDLAYRKGYNQAIKDVEALINGSKK